VTPSHQCEHFKFINILKYLCCGYKKSRKIVFLFSFSTIITRIDWNSIRYRNNKLNGIWISLKVIKTILFDVDISVPIWQVTYFFCTQRTNECLEALIQASNTAVLLVTLVFWKFCWDTCFIGGVDLLSIPKYPMAASITYNTPEQSRDGHWRKNYEYHQR